MKIGLAMSGGGALGFAHLGVIKALEENGIEAEYVTGSSMGALVGCFYASGISSDEICEIVRKEHIDSATKIATPSFGKKRNRPGLSTHKTIERLFEKYIPYQTFEELPRHFSTCVVNLNTQQYEIISSGELRNYCLASMSQPVIFRPIVINGNTYVDGGLLNNLPTESIREKCDYIIGVEANPLNDAFKSTTIFDILLRSVYTMVYHNSQRGRDLCDTVIYPRGIDHYTIFQFHKFEEIYHCGYKAAMEMMPRILEDLERLR